MVRWQEAQVQERILDVLKAMGSGTIMDVSRSTKINRITLSKYLAVLNAKGLITYRQIGIAKLYFIPNSSPKADAAIINSDPKEAAT